jgi:hypothetical protein
MRGLYLEFDSHLWLIAVEQSQSLVDDHAVAQNVMPYRRIFPPSRNRDRTVINLIHAE